MPFKPGQSGTPAGRPKRNLNREVDDPAVPWWRIMRKVFGQPHQMDLGHSERIFREMLKKDPKGYLTQMVSFEREDQANREQEAKRLAAEKTANGPPKADEPREPSVQKLRDLADKLLDELIEGVQGERRNSS